MGWLGPLMNGPYWRMGQNISMLKLQDANASLKTLDPVTTLSKHVPQLDLGTGLRLS